MTFLVILAVAYVLLDLFRWYRIDKDWAKRDARAYVLATHRARSRAVRLRAEGHAITEAGIQNVITIWHDKILREGRPYA